MPLNTKATGMAFGTLLALVWLVAMFLSLLTGIGVRTLSTFGSFHPFFSYSWGGMFIMAIEHLVGGYIVGSAFATLYNKFLKSK